MSPVQSPQFSLPPGPALAPWVERLWAFDERTEPATENTEPASEHTLPSPARSARERALPTGCMALVFRLSDAPIRLFEDVEDRAGRVLGHAVFVGARASAYLRDTSRPSSSVGVQFRPGGAAALLGLPAGELSSRHTPLEELWGSTAREMHERLARAPSAGARLALLEELLLARAVPRPALHPAVAHALARRGPGPGTTAALARETGYSERRFIELFHGAVGLTPKAFARVRRFQRTLERARRRRAGWAPIAAECGYCDQSHLVREFRALAGIAPGDWQPAAPDRPNHVPLREDAAGSRTSKRAGARAR